MEVMTINKLVFDLDSFNLIEKNITQPLVVGQHDFYKFEFEFRRNNEVINNPLWAVRVLFERPDGESSNQLSVLLNNGKYEKKLSSWVSDIAGDLKVSVLVDNMAFGMVLLPVRAGLTPSGDTITDMQYQALLNDIRDLMTQIQTVRENNIFVENTSNMAYTLEHLYDSTFKNPIRNLFLTIPNDTTHGYWSGVNFETSSDVLGLNFINNTNLTLKVIKYDNVFNYLDILPNKVYNLTFYCDGINIYCYYLEVEK